MLYSAAEIASILRSEPEPQCPDLEVDIPLTDSRSLTAPDRSIFFAIRTRNNDGHRYVAELYTRGVRNFVVSHVEPALAERTDVNFFVVADPELALQELARHHRRRFKVPVIGITGSRGKTTVKEWLYQLLHADYHIVRSPRSYNSQIGVPLSVWEMDPDTELAIFEAGISLPGEMARLEPIVAPTIGILTNIGDEHCAGFTDRREMCIEKLTLMRRCDCVIYDGDDTLIADAIASAGIVATEIAWSRRDRSRPLYIAATEKDPEATATTITYSYLGREGKVTVPFTADADIENAIHCLATALYLNRPADVIARRMARISRVGTRLNVIEGVNNCMLIIDDYTSDLRSLSPALDFMNRRRTAGRTSTVIISDVTHEQMEPAALYRAIASTLRDRGVTRVIGIGPEISTHSRYFGPEAVFFESTPAFLSEVSTGDFDSELILIKGSAGFNFGQISEMLEARHHETVLEVNLDAVTANFNLFRSMLRPETGIIVMVKASAYGAGSLELAKTLQAQGAAYLAVAVIDEGVELRRAGIDMPIMVLNPKVVNYKSLFAYELEPEVFSFEMLDEIIREASKRGITDYPVHIKIDSGMHRLGFVESDIPELVARLSGQSAVKVRSIFSHLATADCPDMNDYTTEQFRAFDRCCSALRSGLHDEGIMRHILNSAGIARFPDHQYEMVRLGIGLYGVAPLPLPQLKELKTVSTLRTIVISIKEWPAGTTIGYARRGVLSRPSRVATIPVGYADGLNRHFGQSRSSVSIRGVRCPIIGNICMDACMVDVTDCPECSVGDAVEIFGNNVPVEELAALLDTIPYEILTSVSTRVKRVYYRE